MTLLIDANVIVRYLVGDHTEHLAVATTLFTQVERGELEIIILDSVVMEAFFVLTKWSCIQLVEVISGDILTNDFIVDIH